jgi:hypothetical protein
VIGLISDRRRSREERRKKINKRGRKRMEGFGRKQQQNTTAERRDTGIYEKDFIINDCGSDYVIFPSAFVI